MALYNSDIIHNLLEKAEKNRKFAKDLYLICNAFMRGVKTENPDSKPVYIIPTYGVRETVRRWGIHPTTLGFILKSLEQLGYIDKIKFPIPEKYRVGKAAQSHKHLKCYRTLPSLVWKNRGNGIIYHHRFYDNKEFASFLKEKLNVYGKLAPENLSLKSLIAWIPKKEEIKPEDVTLEMHQKMVDLYKKVYGTEGIMNGLYYILFAYQNPALEFYRSLLHVIDWVTMEQLKTKTPEERRKYWDKRHGNPT